MLVAVHLGGVIPCLIVEHGHRHQEVIPPVLGPDPVILIGWVRCPCRIHPVRVIGPQHIVPLDDDLSLFTLHPRHLGIRCFIHIARSGSGHIDLAAIFDIALQGLGLGAGGSAVYHLNGHLVAVVPHRDCSVCISWIVALGVIVVRQGLLILDQNIPGRPTIGGCHKGHINAVSLIPPVEGIFRRLRCSLTGRRHISRIHTGITQGIRRAQSGILIIERGNSDYNRQRLRIRTLGQDPALLLCLGSNRKVRVGIPVRLVSGNIVARFGAISRIKLNQVAIVALRVLRVKGAAGLLAGGKGNDDLSAAHRHPGYKPGGRIQEVKCKACRHHGNGGNIMSGSVVGHQGQIVPHISCRSLGVGILRFAFRSGGRIWRNRHQRCHTAIHRQEGRRCGQCRRIRHRRSIFVQVPLVCGHTLMILQSELHLRLRLYLHILHRHIHIMSRHGKGSLNRRSGIPRGDPLEHGYICSPSCLDRRNDGIVIRRRSHFDHGHIIPHGAGPDGAAGQTGGGRILNSGPVVWLILMSYFVDSGGIHLGVVLVPQDHRNIRVGRPPYRRTRTVRHHVEVFARLTRSLRQMRCAGRRGDDHRGNLVIGGHGAQIHLGCDLLLAVQIFDRRMGLCGGIVGGDGCIVYTHRHFGDSVVGRCRSILRARRCLSIVVVIPFGVYHKEGDLVGLAVIDRHQGLGVGHGKQTDPVEQIICPAQVNLIVNDRIGRISIPNRYGHTVKDIVALPPGVQIQSRSGLHRGSARVVR